MPIKVALPKGRLLGDTATLLKEAGWGLTGYHEKTRLYRLKSDAFSELTAKVFHEKDVPVQVAIGNYDLGICGLDWVEELMAKYPSSALVRVKDLKYGAGVLYLVGSESGGTNSLEKLKTRPQTVRIASEYPNLAEALALNLRLRRFNIYPLWGAAEGYPPDTADLALIPGEIGEPNFGHDLVVIREVLAFRAFLIANQNSWETRDMRDVLASLDAALPLNDEHPLPVRVDKPAAAGYLQAKEISEDEVRLALPDGHQQEPAVHLLHKAGFKIDDYPSTCGNRRPIIHLDGVSVKVIRPQDMPLQVANGNFDLALTGKDWVREHRYQFPSSPLTEMLDLGFGRVKIVAVVVNDLPVSDTDGLRQLWAERPEALRIASEYTNIADKYARDNHLGRYRIVPTWGATEAFLPEDADLLIENTQTGRTLAKHNLKIIDTIFHSSACLISNSRVTLSPLKQRRMESIVAALRTAVKEV
jgi:ATP phosphoribosyltransferase